MTDPAFCREAVERTVRELGRLDILVNNAAYQEQQDDLEDITDEQFDRTFQTNIYGYFYMAKAALPHLKEGGAIINSGSITGMQGSKDLMDYASTKGAIHAFTKSLAQNLVERGIRVNCVAPGPVWTPLHPVGQARRAGRQARREDADGAARASRRRSRRRSSSSPRRPTRSYITGEVLTAARRRDRRVGLSLSGG